MAIPLPSDAERDQHDREQRGRPSEVTGPYLANRDGRQHRALAHRGDRRHARRPARGTDAGDERHERAHEERDDHRARREDRRPCGRSIPIVTNSLFSNFASPRPRKSPSDRAEQADHEGLDHHRPQHLAARRAERAQRRELAHPLGDRDRERVRDHEGADEERDAREGEQDVLEEGDEAARSFLSSFDLRVRCRGRRRRRQQRLDLGDELRIADARLRLDPDHVELARPCRRRCWAVGQVEDREGRAADRADAGELGDARDARTIAGRADAWTPIVSPTSKPFAAAVALSIAIWSAPRRPGAGGQLRRVELLLGRGSTEKPSDGAPPVVDHLPVLADQLERVARHRAGGARPRPGAPAPSPAPRPGRSASRRRSRSCS